MAQTGYTPIQLYYSSTTTNAPLAANLAGGELAINITDGKLFYKDNSNTVQVIGWKVRPANAGGTGQTSFAVGDLLYADTTTTLAKLPDVATGNALISGGVGVAPSYGKIGLTTHVSGTLPVANGGTGQSSNLTQYGVVYGSSTTAMATSAAGTSTQVLHGNASGAPTWSAVSLTADVTGTLPVANGGTGLTSATGTVIQTVSATYSTTTSSTAGSFVTTGLAASITPQFSNSKILIIAAVPCGAVLTSVILTIKRGTTALQPSGFGFAQLYPGANTIYALQTMNYLDSPATTSSTTYTVFFSTTNGSVFPNNADGVITLMEIRQ